MWSGSLIRECTVEEETVIIKSDLVSLANTTVEVLNVIIFIVLVTN